MRTKWFIAAAVLGTIALLTLGVTLPSMEVKGRLFGFISMGAERRSISGLIIQLFGENVLLAVLILLFAIIVPLVKLILTLGFVFHRNLKNHNRLHALVHGIGKWSMVDVFTATMVVSLITFNNLRAKIFSTKAVLLPGFYFFLAYCIGSIASTYLLNRAMRSHPTGVPADDPPRSRDTGIEA